jgi:hypothetical protein
MYLIVFFHIINSGYNKDGTPEEAKYPNGCYLSGPKFFSLLRELLPFYPTYYQLVELAKNRGESTSREKLFTDVFNKLEENERIEVYEFFLDRLEMAPDSQKSGIRQMLNGASISYRMSGDFCSNIPKNSRKKIFISYSWDSNNHKTWVKELANKLSVNFEVSYDALFIRPGTNIIHKIETELLSADFVFLICTEGYKLKAEDRVGGVGFEYILIANELYNDQKNINGKYLPILRGSEIRNSVPQFLKAFSYIDFRDDSRFTEVVNQLMNDLINENNNP